MALEPFASVEDLEARWRPLSEDEAARAEVLLSDASVFVMASLDRAGIGYEEPDEKLSAALTAVVCNMVRRSMDVPGGVYGVSQMTTSAIGYSETASYVNPNGDFYLTKSEKRLLGIGSGRYGSIRPAIHNAEGGLIDGW